MLMNVRHWAVIAGLLIDTSLQGQSQRAPQYISLAEAESVINAYQEKLPKSLPAEALQDSKSWHEFVAQRDRQVRARLQQGDLDTLANLLLFGTSYTRQPVITPALLSEISSGATQEQPAAWNIYSQRLHDLTVGLAGPGANQRLIYMRALVEKQGFHFRTAEDLDEVQKFLATNLVRMLRDDRQFAAALETARKADAEAEFQSRSRVFQQRGISVDTTFLPNLAIEDALKQLKERGLLKSGSIERVAVVGPGLDVINKDVGFDFYPEQTIQPFAVMDTLLRLGLAKAGQVQVTTLDISANVNSHLKLARERAVQGTGYTVQLPLRADIHWTPGTVSYWQSFGSMIGKPVPPLAAPQGAGEAKVRAVRISPSHVTHVRPADLNVVLQRLDLPQNERFDMVIGTNIFVYYDELEQALAEANIAKMLKPNGILLTNDALPAGDGAAFEVIDFSTTIYSDRRADGDRIVWMRMKRAH